MIERVLLKTIEMAIRTVHEHPDCDSWFNAGYKDSGVYKITFNGKQRDVYCNMNDVKNEGWTVILKRINGSVDFNQNWSGYKAGFGQSESEYWFGNDDIHALTSIVGKTVYLKISATTFEGQSTTVVYKGFKVENEANKYKLHTGVFQSGNSAHSNDFLDHDGMFFSAPDVDNDVRDIHCAENRGAGFWFKYCHMIFPTAPYHSNQVDCPLRRGIYWTSFKGENYCLKTIEMAIRITSEE